MKQQPQMPPVELPLEDCFKRTLDVLFPLQDLSEEAKDIFETLFFSGICHVMYKLDIAADEGEEAFIAQYKTVKQTCASVATKELFKAHPTPNKN